MSVPKLPLGWQAGEFVNRDSIQEGPPQPKDSSRLSLYGLIDDEVRYRIYEMPSDTPLAEIVDFFSVGSHGAMSYGYDATETIRKVAAVVTKVVRIAPARPCFADSAGLMLRFTRRVTETDLQQIEALFPEDEAMQLGLDGYISDWDGESRMLERVMKEGTLHLWWD
jgi:hypothetical protein